MTEIPDRKKQRHRSPAYPSVDLRTAVEKATIIYREEKRNPAPIAVVTEHCGYDVSSSSGLRLVAALKQFGLLIEDGSNEDRQVRLSELALDILLAESEESPDRLQALKTAALSPVLHRKLWDHYQGELPSKASLRAFLIRQMEFNDAHVDRFIRQFQTTISYARVDEPDTMSVDADSDPE